MSTPSEVRQPKETSVRQPDEIALWTNRTAGVKVRYVTRTSWVRGVQPRQVTATPRPSGEGSAAHAGEDEPGVRPVPAAGAARRLKVLNSGRATEIRRRIYHARRAAARAGRNKALGARRRLRRWWALSDATRGRVLRGAAPGGAQGARASRVADRAEVVGRTLSECREHWAERKSPTSLHALVAALYADGQLLEPHRLLVEHPQLAEQFTPGQMYLARNVSEQARMLNSPPRVPARSLGYAQRSEKGRVLYCAHGVHPYQSNGYAIRTRGIVGGMRAAGHDVVVAARPGFPWDAKAVRSAKRKHSFVESVDGIEHVFSFGPSLRRQPLQSYLESAVDSYLRVIARNRPSHVHAASNHITALPALIAARLTGLPFTYEVRGFWEYALAPGEEGLQERGELAAALEDLVMSEADHVFVLTSEMREELAGRGVALERMTVTPNGVDPSQFQPLPAVGDLHRSLAIEPDRTVIGYLGSMVAYEGLEDLVEACLLLAEERSDFELVLAGDGPVLPRITDILEERGEKLSYRLLGRIDANKIPVLMNGVDIVACPRTPTRVTRLVSPLKPLEALAAGVPVVLSDLPVLRSLAEECGGAQLFPAGDVRALAATLESLIEDPERRADLGRAGRSWVMDRRRWSVLGADLGGGILAAAERRAVDHLAGSRTVGSLRVAVIADTFTTSSLNLAVDVVTLDRHRWPEQMGEGPIDALFVESAWSGNDGQWARGVGHYSDEESSALRALLAHCREWSIPTVFWNKEDPVHFARFIENARLFDLVLTTDNRSIPRYQEQMEQADAQVGSMPFFAQPELHHPVTDGPAVTDRPVMYAGSYYGNRYKDRSEVLRMLLSAAQPHGVTIFDRQADIADSPYRFPDELAPFVEGGLPYSEMIDAYRRYPLHINVNSVTESETMFSRRVVEIGCVGGAVASGPSAALNHMFRGLVPTLGRISTASAAMDALLADAELRNLQGWNLRRFVRRSHTLEHRLLVLFRRLGLDVCPSTRPDVVVNLIGSAASADWQGLLSQTSPPAAVRAAGVAQEIRSALQDVGIRLLSPEDLDDTSVSAITATWSGVPLDRVVLEDLMDVLMDSGCSEAVLDSSPIHDLSTPLAMVSDEVPAAQDAVMAVARGDGDGRSVVVRRGLLEEAATHAPSVPAADEQTLPGGARRVVVAGHDLKFAGEIIDRLRADGHDVRIDQWSSHQEHDEDLSLELVTWADVVLCEWGLGNAAWYSQHKRDDQALIVRVHSQELFRSYFSRMALANVDRFVFVAPHIMDAAERFRGVAGRPAEVIPNIVRPAGTFRGHAQRQFVLGMVGIVPRGKRFDRAVELLALLRAHDDRYVLRVKGRQPEDYPWMAARPEEMRYYEDLRRRLEEDPVLRGAVHLDGFSSEREELERWYGSIGVALSVSDFESFHFTVVDGAMNGAVPRVLTWPGADRLFPAEWLSSNLDEMRDSILALRDQEEYDVAARAARAETEERFSGRASLDRWSEIICEA